MIRPLLIRPVTEADLPDLRAMLLALARHEGGEDVGSLAALQAGLRARLFHALIHDHGMVIYYPDFSTHRGEAGVYVQDLFVAPEARGQGLARSLLRAAFAQQDWGARYLTLGVSPGNAVARGFYDKAGFTSRGYETLIHTDPDQL